MRPGPAKLPLATSKDTPPDRMPSSRRASSLLRSAAAGLFLVTGSFAAAAQSPGTAERGAGSPLASRVIVIARTPGDDGVVTRLRAELAESDWSALEAERDERAAPSPLAS